MSRVIGRPERHAVGEELQRRVEQVAAWLTEDPQTKQVVMGERLGVSQPTIAAYVRKARQQGLLS